MSGVDGEMMVPLSGPRAGTVTIGLLWHSVTSANLGIGALTLASMTILRETAGRLGLTPRFLVLGWREPLAPYGLGPDVEMVPLRTRDLLPVAGGLPRALRRCDLVLDIGAGDSFTDIYGLSRSLKILVSKMLVLASGRPLVLSPQTIGPFGRPWIRVLARAVMNRARAVVTRDALSTAFVRTMGVRSPVIEATDVALRLAWDPPPPRAGGPVRVGLNVSGLLFNGGYTGDNQFGLRADYPALTRAMVRGLQARGCEVHLIGHVQAETLPVEDDQAAGAALAAEFPGTVLAPRFASPVAAKSWIAGMDFMIGARMHACIAAFSSGVPVLPVAYSRKFAGLFGTLGYTLLADPRTEDEAAILDRLWQALDDRDRIRADMAACLATGLARLGAFEALLAEILAGLPAARAGAPGPVR